MFLFMDSGYIALSDTMISLEPVIPTRSLEIQVVRNFPDNMFIGKMASSDFLVQDNMKLFVIFFGDKG